MASQLSAATEAGPAETVRHGETGNLIDPGDIAGFSQAVTRLLDDHSLHKSMGRAGRAHVCARFSVETASDAYRRIFEDLLKLNSQ